MKRFLRTLRERAYAFVDQVRSIETGWAPSTHSQSHPEAPLDRLEGGVGKGAERLEELAPVDGRDLVAQGVGGHRAGAP